MTYVTKIGILIPVCCLCVQHLMLSVIGVVMKNKNFGGLTTLVLAMGMSSMVYANENPLSAQMKVFQVNVDKNTQKELKTTDQVKPNQVLEYQVTYSNQSNSSLKALKLNLPLPAYVSYTGKNTPKNTYASTDGVHFAKAPLTRIENGKKVNVPLSEYRALQWQVDELKPKQKITVAAQVRVNAAE